MSRRLWIGSLALLGTVACSHGAAPENRVCASDADCVWASGCCNDCVSYSGRAAGDRVVTRSEQERIDRACESRDERCPHVNCVEPPPCGLSLAPACRAARCVVVASGPPVLRREGATCSAESCGPLPAFDGGKCDSFAQAAYERCACIAGGRTDCGAVWWPALCGARSACAPASPTPAMAGALAGCEGS
jgi:hypothetical protein